MRKIIKCIKSTVLVSILIAGMVLYLFPSNARADIKELRIGIGIDADSLNPQEQTTTLIQNICDLIYDNFLFQTPEGKLEPRLASKYEISGDGLTWTLHLRKGVKFSDGTDFNADAVVLSWQRILDPKMKVPLRFAVSMVKGAVKVDDHTVQLKLKYPFAPLAPTLSLTIASVIRLTAYLYRDEIAVLRLIGATEFYIRGPFYAEGLVQGAAGGTVAMAGLYVAYRLIRPQSDAALLGTVLVGDFLPPAQLIFLLALGAAAGLLGAILSVRREAGVV